MTRPPAKKIFSLANLRHLPSTWLRAITVLVVVGALGSAFLIRSHAATASINLEAEDGVVSGGATKTTGTDGASGPNKGVVVFQAGAGGDSTKPVLVNGKLQKGSTGQALKMAGVAVWGVQDEITENANTGNNNYANRAKIASTIKAWGGNHIRLRLLASDYDSQKYMTKAAEIQQVKDWRDAAKAAGLYLQVCWWDSLDGSYNNANWATSYSKAFPMMNDVITALGNDPMVYYEPFNEPNNVSESAWLTAMKATVANYRSKGYTGILLIDTNGWSHEYHDADMAAIEQYDATQPGMNGKHQIIFGKHDYGNEYSGNWTAAQWASNNNGSETWDFTKHAAWETEFGNYNLNTETLPWSQSAATAMAAQVNSGTVVGASAFVFNWVDANTMVGNDYTTPNTWGGYVKTNFLSAVR